MEPKVVINTRVVEGWKNINAILLKDIDEFKTELGKIAIENNSTQINEHVHRINLVVQELAQFRMKVNKLNEEGGLDKYISIKEQEEIYQNMVNLLQEIKKECELYRERKSNQNSTSPQDSQVQFTELVKLFDQIQDKFDTFVRQNHGTAKKLLPFVIVNYEVKQQEPFAKMQWIMEDRRYQKQDPAKYKAEREAREREVKAYNQAKEQHERQLKMREELKPRIEVEQKRFDSVSSDTSPKSPTLLERIGDFLLRRSKKEKEDSIAQIQKFNGSVQRSELSGYAKKRMNDLSRSRTEDISKNVLPRTSTALLILGVFSLVAGAILTVAGIFAPVVAPALLGTGILLFTVGSGLLVARSAAIKLAKDAEIREAAASKESGVSTQDEEALVHSSDGLAMIQLDAQGHDHSHGLSRMSGGTPTVGQAQQQPVRVATPEPTPASPRVRFSPDTKEGGGQPGEDSNAPTFRR